MPELPHRSNDDRDRAGIAALNQALEEAFTVPDPSDERTAYIERVARAIFDALEEGTARVLEIDKPFPVTWGQLGDGMRQTYLDAAVAALSVVAQDG